MAVTSLASCSLDPLKIKRWVPFPPSGLVAALGRLIRSGLLPEEPGSGVKQPGALLSLDHFGGIVRVSICGDIFMASVTTLIHQEEEVTVVQW